VQPVAEQGEHAMLSAARKHALCGQQRRSRQRRCRSHSPRAQQRQHQKQQTDAHPHHDRLDRAVPATPCDERQRRRQKCSDQKP
jgi:hypothetical protein